MATDEYVPPTYGSDGFNCPHCTIWAHQVFQNALWRQPAGFVQVQGIDLSTCQRCEGIAVWVEGKLVHPALLTAPHPHNDLAGPALQAYVEAREVVSNSPRAAAALLRLCLQLLVPTLGASSDNLNEAVAELVKTGLPPGLQKAMDALRVIGNESVHPGQIDLNDDPSIAISLFELVNLLVENMITQPRALDDLYDRLPESKREQIERRDKADP